MNGNREVSRELAEFLADARFADLRESTVAATELAVLDWIGSALAGAFEPPGVIARAVVAGFGDSSEATVFPAGRASAAGAALANGVASHILELDDIHKGSTVHGAAPIIPAALAVAEREGASGEAFLLAVALGYEAALRVGEAVNPSHYRFFHPTGTAATFGAAAAAGSLRGLNAGRMLDALGTAGTQAAGLWEFNADGAMSKHLHPGMAAFHGVVAADLAVRGFTGASRILEGSRGFFAAMSDGADPGKISDGLGSNWKVEENGYKLHACCGHTHTAIDSALDLREMFGWDATDVVESIERIEIALYGPGFAIVREPWPRTPYQAQFSVAYCVAVALLEGAVGLAQFSEDRFNSVDANGSAVNALLARTSVTVDDELTARYPSRWPARLVVTLRDGTQHVREADFPRGHPENPVPRDVLDAKAIGLIAPRYSPESASAAIAWVDGLRRASHVSDGLAQVVGEINESPH